MVAAKSAMGSGTVPEGRRVQVTPASAECRVPALRVVEPGEVAAALVVVGPNFADETVAKGQELGAPVEQAPTVARMVEGHGPLDRHLVVVLHRVLERPARVEM